MEIKPVKDSYWQLQIESEFCLWYSRELQFDHKLSDSDLTFVEMWVKTIEDSDVRLGSKFECQGVYIYRFFAQVYHGQKMQEKCQNCGMEFEMNDEIEIEAEKAN